MRQLFVNFLCLCLFLPCGGTVFAQFDKHDSEAIRTFLESTNSKDEKNGPKVNPAYDSNNPSTWSGIEWKTRGNVKFIEKIQWNGAKLGGNLDLSDCTELTGLYVTEPNYSSNWLIREVNLKGCIQLESLQLSQTDINELDLSDCKKLVQLNNCDAEPEDGQECIEKYKIPWTTLCASETEESRNNSIKRHANGYPTMLLLDPYGRILHLNARGETLVQLLEQIYEPERFTPQASSADEKAEKKTEKKTEKKAEKTVEKSEKSKASSKPAEPVKSAKTKKAKKSVKKSAPKKPRQAGDRASKVIDGVKYTFRWCPPGNASKLGAQAGFWLMETEVTVEMFESFVKATGYRSVGTSPMWYETRENGEKQWAFHPELNWQNPGYPQTPQHPVVCVSCEDAEAFSEWFSQKLGKETILPPWEVYAHVNKAYQTFSPLDCCWLRDNSEGHAHPVGEKTPNDWGIYDSLGNVSEWCSELPRAMLPACMAPGDFGKYNSCDAMAGSWYATESWFVTEYDYPNKYPSSFYRFSRSSDCGFRLMILPDAPMEEILRNEEPACEAPACEPIFPNSLFGKITDENGKPLPDMVVLVLETDTLGVEREWGIRIPGDVLTDADGNYKVPELMPGNYKVLFCPAKEENRETGPEQNQYFSAPDIEQYQYLSIPENTKGDVELNLTYLQKRNLVVDYIYSDDAVFDESPLRNFRICKWTDGDFTFDWLFAPSLQGVFLRTSQQKTLMYDFGEVPFDSVTKYDESVSKPEVVFLKNHVYGIRTPDGHYVKILVKGTEVVKE